MYIWNFSVKQRTQQYNYVLVNNHNIICSKTWPSTKTDEKKLLLFETKY